MLVASHAAAQARDQAHVRTKSQVPGAAGELHPALFVDPGAPAVTWAHYDLLAQCQAAVDRVTRIDAEAVVRRRGGEPIPEDSLALGLAARPMTGQSPLPPPRAIEAARRCRARFSAARVPSRELDALATLAVAANDIPLLDSVLDRKLAELPTKSDRAHALLVLNEGGLSLGSGMAPADSAAWADRHARLEQMIAARWPGAVFVRVLVAYFRLHAQILGRWRLESDTATTPVRVADLEAAHQEILALAKMPPSEPLGPDEQHSLAELTQSVMSISNAYDARLIEEAPTASAERLRRLIAERDSAVMGHADTLAIGTRPAITGAYWMRSDAPGLRTGQPSLPTGRPRVVYISDGLDDNLVSTHETLVRVKRLQDIVPALDVVIIAPVTGIRHRGLHGEGENRVRNVFGQVLDTASLATEAESLRQFYFNDLGLRGTIVLDTVAQLRLPAPDRRWIPQGSAVRARSAVAGLVLNQGGTESPTASVLLDGGGRIVLHEVDTWPQRTLTVIARRLAELGNAPPVK